MLTTTVFELDFYTYSPSHIVKDWRGVVYITADVRQVGNFVVNTDAYISKRMLCWSVTFCTQSDPSNSLSTGPE
jgi:hypothetical protein